MIVLGLKWLRGKLLRMFGFIIFCCGFGFGFEYWSGVDAEKLNMGL